MEFVISDKYQERFHWDLTPAKVFNDHTIDGSEVTTAASIARQLNCCAMNVLRTAKTNPCWSTPIPYLAVPAARLESKRFKGLIDITRFYQVSRKLECFTGSRGPGKWVGFEGNDPGLANPDERHGIEWPALLERSYRLCIGNRGSQI